MIAKRSAPCVTCYRTIEKGAEVQYSKLRRGIRHPVCPPITTAELLAGRERYEAKQRQDADAEEARRYARHDAANPLRAATA